MFWKNNFNKVLIVIVSIVIFYSGIIIFSDFETISKKIFLINYNYFPIIFSLIGLNIFLHSIKYHRLLLQKQQPLSPIFIHHILDDVLLCGKIQNSSLIQLTDKQVTFGTFYP